MYTFVTVEADATPSFAHSNKRSISSIIAEREKDPRKAAALARARKKIAGMLVDDASFSIAQLRLSKGLSQQQLAAKMGVKQPYIARIEKGEDIKASTISNLAGALGVSSEVVFKAIEMALSARGAQ